MNLTTRARHLQSATNWPYQTCLQKIRGLGSGPAEVAKQNQWSIDQADLYLIDPVLAISRQFPLPPRVNEEIVVEDVLIPGNGSTNIVVISEKGPFRPTRLVVPEEVGRNFLFTDIQVGKNSQFASSDAVHAIFFVDQEATKDFSFDFMPRGMTMTLKVTNLKASNEPLAFSAILKGELISAESDVHHRTDRMALGLGATNVLPNKKTRIILRSQLVFRPDYLIVPPDVLDGLRVASLRVVGIEALSKEPQAGRFDLVAETMQLGDWLCIDVVNETDSPKYVFGAIGGVMVR
jgi:hypothetical protein